MDIKKGDIYIVDFGQGIGAEIKGVRPAVIIQNNIGNKYSPITYVAPMTSDTDKARLVGNIIISKEECSLPVDSVIDINQIRSVDKSRLGKCIGKVPDNIIHSFPSFMQFITDGDRMTIENNTTFITKSNNNNSIDNINIETETLKMLKNFYSDYRKDNSIISKFTDTIFSSIIGYLVVPIISFLLGLFLSSK
ncbi:type II toxin-antitoxin system PemK/MazF family toxin [Tissierella praeacuta]|uniref:type II toxin-antitoxin system PemK/MazF family toxin n=1 Tax=Tissierella praeacuta TaxID=43131 RepID=UPI0028AD9907|nr:type II toxin-antitoxin system PemK/MazF family toxin [Tissierella praeacuta]